MTELLLEFIVLAVSFDLLELARQPTKLESLRMLFHFFDGTFGTWNCRISSGKGNHLSCRAFSGKLEPVIFGDGPMSGSVAISSL
jgi:hypothetical protein